MYTTHTDPPAPHREYQLIRHEYQPLTRMTDNNKNDDVPDHLLTRNTGKDRLSTDNEPDDDEYVAADPDFESDRELFEQVDEDESDEGMGEE